MKIFSDGPCRCLRWKTPRAKSSRSSRKHGKRSMALNGKTRGRASSDTRRIFCDRSRIVHVRLLLRVNGVWQLNFPGQLTRRLTPIKKRVDRSRQSTTYPVYSCYCSKLDLRAKSNIYFSGTLNYPTSRL